MSKGGGGGTIKNDTRATDIHWDCPKQTRMHGHPRQRGGGAHALAEVILMTAVLELHIWH